MRETLWGGVLPVLALDHPDQLPVMAGALREAGLRCAELRLKTTGGLREAVEGVRRADPDFVLGAGPVLDAARADELLGAGLDFLVAPLPDEELAARCRVCGARLVPVCETLGDAAQAVRLGLELAQVPADPELVGRIAAQLPELDLIACGVPADSVPALLRADGLLACAVTLTEEETLRNMDSAALTRRTRTLIDAVMGFALAHVGINTPGEAAAHRVARLFERAFGFAFAPGETSSFAGPYVEVMHSLYLGERGHIAIATDHLHRAAAYLEDLGFAADSQTWKWDARGNPVAVYLRQDFGGFAVHLMQRK